MKAALILAAMLVGTAHAGYVYRTDGLTLHLMDSPCTNAKVLDLLLDKYKTEFKQGVATVNGRQISLCWIESGKNEVTIIDEEGSGAALNISAMKKVSSV